jgi:hypothetical protein
MNQRVALYTIGWGHGLSSTGVSLVQQGVDLSAVLGSGLPLPEGKHDLGRLEMEKQKGRRTGTS